MCKHDVINIQHIHSGLVGFDCKKQSRLQWVFLRAKPKAACEPRCLSQAATLSSLSLCANKTSSIDPKYMYLTYRYAARGGPSHDHRKHMHKKLVKIGRVVPKI